MSWSSAKALVLFGVLTSGYLCVAQTDRHITEDPARMLYYQSTFAHGYCHGYEEGFHVGDEDLQMGRRGRPLEKIPEYKQSRAGYPGFGDKDSFQKGYRQGFARGYEDAYAGREFQAANEARAGALGMYSVSEDEKIRRYFDEGFVKGYDLAVHSGDQAVPFTSNSILQYCENSTDPKLKQRETYCQGYTRGFLFGTASRGAISSGVVAQNARSR